MCSGLNHIKIANQDVLEIGLSGKEFTARILVAPNFGANLLEFVFNNKVIIKYDVKALKKADFTGTPILFPTPNRVKNAIVKYNGNDILQEKNGQNRVCHGLVYDEPLEVVSYTNDNDIAQIALALNITKNTNFFKSFPFECRLTIVYILSKDGLSIKYKLENLSQNCFQYGFGLHPYFSFEKFDKLVLPSKQRLELDNNYPTKNIIPLEADFEKEIKDLSFDDDFIRLENKTAFINKQNGSFVEIIPSNEFRHFVVYKNSNDDFICIEPQTCSINAHDLSEQGFEYANILNIAPNEVKEGFVNIFVKGI